MKTFINLFLVSLIGITLFAGCSKTLKGVKNDSSKNWETTKEGTKEAWQTTKKAVHEATKE